MTDDEAEPADDIDRQRPQPMFTEDPRDRDPGLLTYADREYLLGQKEVDEGAEAQSRQRMRDRVRNGLLDFELLFLSMSKRDINIIFDDVSDPPWPSESDISEVYRGAEYALAFIYHGISEHSHANFEQLLCSGIERGTERSQKARGPHHRVADVSVDIEFDWQYNIINHEHALEKLRSGDDLTDRELGVLVRRGDLTPEDWKRLRNRNMDSRDGH